MITIQPLGGLGNRLRVIHSAQKLAGRDHLPIHLIWKMDSSLNCHYHTLFKPSRQIVVHEISDSIVVKFIKRVTKNRFFNSRKLANFDSTLNNKQVYDMLKKKADFKELLNNDSIFIETDQSFYGSYNPFLAPEPSEFISQKVNMIQKEFGAFTIGVHIRRKDNINSIRMSPTNLFVEKMRSEIESKPEVNFFLSTDSIETEQEIISKFGRQKVIVQQQKALARNSERGVTGALVDMLCLSKTNKILGSYYSSFSNIAAAIGNVELEIVRSHCKM